MNKMQNDSISKEMEIPKIELNRNLEIKNTTTELKSSLEVFNSRLQQTKARISRLENRSYEIIEYEEEKENRMKKSKQS